jgi:hypothetical protein
MPARRATVHRLAGRNDNPMPESTLFSKSGTKNFASASLPGEARAEVKTTGEDRVEAAAAATAPGGGLVAGGGGMSEGHPCFIPCLRQLLRVVFFFFLY